MADQNENITLILSAVGTEQAAKKVGKLTAETVKLGKGVETTTRTYQKGNKEVVVTTRAITRLDKKTGQLVRTTEGLVTTNKKLNAGIMGNTDSIGRIVAKVALWTAATGLVFGSIRALGGGLEVIKDFDSGMVDLQKVFQGTTSELAMLKKEILSTSIEMGSLSKDTLQAAINLGRMGKTRVEIAELTRVALLGQNIAEIEAAQGVRFLNAALLQFEKQADQAIDVLDKWNELSNRTPVTTRDLAEAISIAGAVTSQAGADIEFLNAEVAALAATMAKSGHEIGTALKTITAFAYRKKTIPEIERITGIEVIDKATSQLMDIDTLLQRVAARWDTLTEAEQNELAQTMAGVRRKGFFLNLMRNFDIVLENQVKQWAAAGSAIRENEIRLSSLATKMTQLHAAFERLAISTGDTGLILPAMKGLVDLLTTAVKGLGELHAAIQLVNIGISVGFVAAMRKATVAIGIFQSVAGKWLVGITAAVSAFTLMTYAFTINTRVADEARRATQRHLQFIDREIQFQTSLQQAYKTYNTLYQEFIDLRKKGEKTEGVEAQLKIILDGINDVMPGIVTDTNNYALALDQMADASNIATEELRKLNEEKLLFRISGLEMEIPQLQKDFKKAAAEATKAFSTEIIKGQRTGLSLFDPYSTMVTETLVDTPDMLNRLASIGDSLIEAIELRRELVRESEGEMTEDIIALNNRIDTLKALEGATRALATAEETLKHLRKTGLLPKRDRPKSREKPLVDEEELALQRKLALLDMQLAGATRQEIIQAQIDSLMAQGVLSLQDEVKLRQLLIQLAQTESKVLIAAQQRIGETLRQGISDSMVLAVTDGASRVDKLRVWNRVGQSIGDQIGQAVATRMIGEITKATTITSIISGNIVGGLISGGIGILSQLLFPVDDPIKEEVRAQEDNTSAIRELTDEFRSFTERFINAPATFALGQTRAVGREGGTIPQSPVVNNGGNIMNFSIIQQPGQSGRDVAQEVAQIFGSGYGRGEEFSTDITS